MPKAKRTLTEEQKNALRERLAAARAKKAAMKAADNNTPAKPAPEVPVEEQGHEPEPIDYKETIKNGEEDTAELLKRALEAIETLAKMQTGNVQAPAQPARNLTRTVSNYSINPGDYPNPVERLMQEPRLAQFAFPVNYELVYDFALTRYTDINKENHVEPKFSLELRRIVRDELTGEATNGRYVLCSLVMHEDPEAALAVAAENGIEVRQEDEQAFLNEMRYIQMRNWLLESFFLPISTNKNNHREIVVNGKMVDFIEVNNTTPQTIPFNELNRYKV